MTRTPSRLAFRTPLALLLVAFLAGAASASARAWNVQVVDQKTGATITPAGDNLGQGIAGSSNLRNFSYTDTTGGDLTVQDCSIGAPWTLGSVPGDGSSVTIMPGLPNLMTVGLAVAQYGYYSATVSCLGDGGFNFPVSWQLLNGAATLSVAAGSTVLAPNGSFNFPSTLAGTTASQTFTVTNFGATALSISNVAVTGAGFSLPSPASPQTIPAGATASFAVNFSPTAGTSYTGSLSITSNDSVGNSKWKITLGGSGIAATPTILIGDLSNGNTAVNSGQTTVMYGQVAAGVSVTHTFQITNSGNVALNISNGSAIVSGSGFTASAPPPSISANGGTGTFTVTFMASTGGSYSGQVSIVSNALPSPFTFNLAATIPSSPTSIVVRGPNGIAIGNGGSYNAGGVLLGNTLTLPFTVSNPTAAVVVISPFSITGDPSFAYNPGGDSGGLAPNVTWSEGLQFKPTTTTSVNSALVFSAGGVPWTINLTGYGITAEPSLAVTRHSTGAVVQNGQTYAFYSNTTVGTPVSEQFDIADNGPAALDISSFTVTSPAGCFIDLASPTSPVTSGAPTSARIRLLSSTPVNCTGTVTIVSNDPTHPTFTFNLTGAVSAVPFSLSIVSGDGLSVPPGGSYASFPVTTSNVAVSRTFTITNSSAATITLSNVNSILATSGGFFEITPPPATIAGSGGTGVFRIRLLDANPGTYTGTITLDGDAAGPYVFSISGTVD